MSITRVYSDGNTVSGSDMNTIVSGINTNETSINGLTTAKVDKVSGKSLVLDTEIAKIHNHTNETILDNTTASYTTTEQTKLSGISENANNYVLPIATTSIGGVKSGTDITVDISGNVSVNDDSHNHIIDNIDGLQTVLDNKVDDSQVLTNVPVGAVFTDTITTINGKTGAIAKADIVALGIPVQDTTYNIATQSTSGLESGADKTKLDGITASATKTASSLTNGNVKIDDVETIVYTHPSGTNPHGTTKSDVSLGNCDNTSDIAKNVLSATKLTTPRMINGIAFDGSANIALPTLSNSSDSSMNNFKITNVGEPINGQDVVTKNYADSLRSGLSVKDPVRVATTINLVGTYDTLVFTSTDLGALVIDGITLTLNDRILVKNQTIATQNGIYYVSQVGDISTPYKLTRANDSNTSSKVVEGMSTWIDEGTVNSDCRWVLITNSTIILDTTGLVFTKDFQSSDLIANGGITKSGNTISLTTGIATVGTYKSVTVDTNGRVTSGTNPTTIVGYGITDFASNVLSTILTGLSTATNSVISATDTVLSSLGKLQKQISDNLSTLSTHIADVVSHITSAERTLWNSKQNAIVSPTLQTATLQNGWVDQGSPYATVGYYRTVEGMINLQGVIKSGTITDGTILFTLPEGFRPTTSKIVRAMANNGTTINIVYINISTDGKVAIGANGANTWLSLEGISFSTF